MGRRVRPQGRVAILRCGAEILARGACIQTSVEPSTEFLLRDSQFGTERLVQGRNALPLSAAESVLSQVVTDANTRDSSRKVAATSGNHGGTRQPVECVGRIDVRA